MHLNNWNFSKNVRDEKKMKYVIMSPRQKWGGAVVCHILCKYLSELGYDASIFITDNFKIKNNSFISNCKYYIKYIKFLIINAFDEKKNKYHKSVKSVKRKYFPFVDNKTIVIYPDIVYGNPLHSKHVVRWLLYYYDFVDEPNAYEKKDLFICYREQFNNWELNPTGRKVTCSYFDLDLYKRTNYGLRNGKCYIVRKGRSRQDLPDSFDGPIIDDLPEEEKVKVFNECEICISYDTQTAYSGIAAMCGCLSVVIPEFGKSRDDYLKKDDIDYGVAFGFSEDEIKYAKETAHLVKTFYEQCNRDGFESVKGFVKMCEEYFDEQ